MSVRPERDGARGSDPLELLRSAPIGVATPAEVDEERARLMPWLEERVAALPAQRRRAERALRLRRGLGAFAAAAGLAVALGVVWMGTRPSAAPRAASDAPASQAPTAPLASGAGRRGGLRLVDGSVEGRSPEISADSHFAPDSHVRTKAGGQAVFVADAGYRVELSERTELSFPAHDDAGDASLRLDAGAVTLSVEPLPPGHRLEVRTADARVRVKGTRFTVRLWGEIPRTCVSVAEGVVEVERASGVSRLTAGQSEGCEPASTVTAARRAPPPPSTLDEETRLLTAALAAEKGKDVERALRLYADFLARYPRSRFAPEARAGQGRLRGAE